MAEEVFIASLEPGSRPPKGKHRHLCLNCDRVVGFSDECEGDKDHDYELCDRCLMHGYKRP